MSINRNVGIVTLKSCYTWHISDFFTIGKDVGDCFHSPEFETCNRKCVKWHLSLYPKGDENRNKDYICLFIHYLGEKEVTADIKFSLLNVGLKEVLPTEYGSTKFSPGRPGYGKGYIRFASRAFVTDEKNKLLVNDTLKVLCEITVTPNIVDQKLKNFTPLCLEDSIVPRYFVKEFNDLEKLLENGDHSDVTFKIGEDSLKAHKAIITSRSSVFKAMFQHNTLEQQNNEIEVIDIKPEVMKEVLRFMYSSKVMGIDKIACDLLQAAEKYSLEELKILCEKTLFEELTVENALEYLKIADMYNTMDLKSKVIELIVKNKDNIVHKAEFQSLVTSHAELFWQVFHALVPTKSTS